ncbi:MAG TPA: hypothetical protein PKW95_21680 [bacterium]|nr:hypothetical protein [bacterium]
MKRRIVLLTILLLVFSTVVVHADDTQENDGSLSGVVGVAAMYDSHFDLANEFPNDTDGEDEFIYQLDAKLGMKYSWGSNSRLEFDLQELAYWPYFHTEKSWYVSNGNLYFGFFFGANSISMLDSVRYFVPAEKEETDLFRNSFTMAGKHKFSNLWEGLLGYENIINLHFDSAGNDYSMNGGFIELRNTWTPLVYTYYSFDCLYYIGNNQMTDPAILSPPNDGYRYSGKVGFDALFGIRHYLQGSYTFQRDRGDYLRPAMIGNTNVADNQMQPPPPDGRRPPPTPLEQVRGFEGEQASLEVDAEFNYAKHKATLLYSIRFNERFSASLYNEFIHKDFIPNGDMPPYFDGDRTDRLFLVSAWFTARTFGQLYAKTYYVLRANIPSDDEDGVQEHIASVGLEYRF